MSGGRCGWLQDKTRQDKTRQDKTRQDKTRQDKTRQDKTRQDKTRQDKTRQDKTRLILHVAFLLLSPIQHSHLLHLHFPPRVLLLLHLIQSHQILSPPHSVEAFSSCSSCSLIIRSLHQPILLHSLHMSILLSSSLPASAWNCLSPNFIPNSSSLCFFSLFTSSHSFIFAGFKRSFK